MAKPWKCRLRFHDWDDRETRKPMSTTKYVCAATPIEKERVLTRVRAQRVSQEPAAAEGFGASTVCVVGLALAVRVRVSRPTPTLPTNPHPSI